jgi:hypothetical protein
VKAEQDKFRPGSYFVFACVEAPEVALLGDYRERKKIASGKAVAIQASTLLMFVPTHKRRGLPIASNFKPQPGGQLNAWWLL